MALKTTCKVCCCLKISFSMPLLPPLYGRFAPLFSLPPFRNLTSSLAPKERQEEAKPAFGEPLEGRERERGGRGGPVAAR